MVQNQPRPPANAIWPLRLTPQRRAMFIGMAMAVIGLGILLWPHETPVAPSQGDDIATLAKLVNLPAAPVAAHWVVGPMSATDSGRAPGPSDWYLDAAITFSADDAAKITGVESFYKSPLLVGKLMRIDDTHVRLILNTQ